jgi:hypothetical protein
VRRALALALLLSASAATGAAAKQKARAGVSRKAVGGAARTDAGACARRYAGDFVVTMNGAPHRLRVVKYPEPSGPPPRAPVPQETFEPPFQACRALGAGWQVAPGSFGHAFLDELKKGAPKPLADALAACPVTYRNVDTVCAPCVAGSTHCPCAARDISDWIFCEHMGG